jgi:hypothetical protein
MIRWLIDFRFAVHYGLNSDIARGPKSATSDIAILTVTGMSIHVGSS